MISGRSSLCKSLDCPPACGEMLLTTTSKAIPQLVSRNFILIPACKSDTCSSVRPFTAKLSSDVLLTMS